MAAGFPVGKTQKIVLDALGITGVAWFGQAEQKFEDLGIIVTSKRVGRGVEPRITVKSRMVGGFTEDGDGDSWREYADVDLSAVQQWIIN